MSVTTATSVKGKSKFLKFRKRIKLYNRNQQLRQNETYTIKVIQQKMVRYDRCQL